MRKRFISYVWEITPSPPRNEYEEEEAYEKGEEERQSDGPCDNEKVGRFEIQKKGLRIDGWAHCEVSERKWKSKGRKKRKPASDEDVSESGSEIDKSRKDRKRKTYRSRHSIKKSFSGTDSESDDSEEDRKRRSKKLKSKNKSNSSRNNKRKKNSSTRKRSKDSSDSDERQSDASEDLAKLNKHIKGILMKLMKKV